MSEQKTKADVAQLLLKTADSLSGLADSVRALCASLADSPQTEAKDAPAKKKQTIPLEKVRGVLAEKSRDGYTAEVRAIIQSFGADRDRQEVRALCRRVRKALRFAGLSDPP